MIVTTTASMTDALMSADGSLSKMAGQRNTPVP
jgi:hypothetical protein